MVRVFQVKYWCRVPVEPSSWSGLREGAKRQVELLRKNRPNLIWPNVIPFETWIFSQHYSSKLNMTRIECGEVELEVILRKTTEFYNSLPKEIQEFMTRFSKIFEDLRIQIPKAIKK